MAKSGGVIGWLALPAEPLGIKLLRCKPQGMQHARGEFISACAR